MRYTVLWSPGTEDDLANIWMNTRDRDKVTAAAQEIDLLLKNDPDRKGESRSEDLRILLIDPLGVNFVVNPDDRIVQIVEVWEYVIRSSN